jgi:hypothetical protein
LAIRATSRHFTISARTKAAKSAGVLGSAVPPISMKRAAIAGSRSAERAGGADGQGVAVRRGARPGFHRRRAGRTAAVLDEGARRPALRELIDHQAGEDVGRLARREGHDHRIGASAAGALRKPA